MTKAKLEVILNEGKIFKLDPKGKYLIVLPNDAKIAEITLAIGRFFEPAKVFCLVAKDVTQIKIAELLEGDK